MCQVSWTGEETERNPQNGAADTGLEIDVADFKTHAIAGCAAGIGTYLLGCWFFQRQVRLKEVLLSGLGAFGTGCLPDAFEPAEHPNHRSFFHSLTAGGVVAFLDWQSVDFDNLSDGEKLAIWVLSAGYLSHLLLDAVTPKALPLM